MRLKQLKIQTLPGIEPGFILELPGEPPDAGVNIVTGPNAIGKSSLARALGYLLDAQKSDPPALSLEAEFASDTSDKATWRVVRNGSEIVWYKDGNRAERPALPGAAQTGLYRLSVEHLLAGDEHDRDLAQVLRNRLRGGFDLEKPRINLGRQFARTEATRLSNAAQTLGQAEGKYEALGEQERELPRLEREIKDAKEAQDRLQRLQQGLELHEAVNAKETCTEELTAYPSGMDRLRGGEQQRLVTLENKSKELQVQLRGRQRELDSAKKALEETGFEQSRPDPERLAAIDLCLQQLGQKEADRSNARKELAQADVSLKKARTPFNEAGAPPKLDEQGLSKAEAVATPLIRAKLKREQLKLRLGQAGAAPDDAEINQLYEAGVALREWLAATAVESAFKPASPDRWPRIALWATLVVSILVLAAVLAGIQLALPAMAAALVAFGAAASGLVFQRRRASATGSAADAAKQRFIDTGLAAPPNWTEATVREYLRSEVEKEHGKLVVQRERAAQAGSIRAELDNLETEITRLQARKQEVAANLGFDPESPSVEPDIFLQHCRQLFEAEDHHVQAQARLDSVERDMAEDVARVHDFLAQWHRTGAPLTGESEQEQDLSLLQASFEGLKRRADKAKDARRDMDRYQEGIRSINDQLKENRREIEAIFGDCKLDPDDRIGLEQRLKRLPEWQEKQKDRENAEREEMRVRKLLKDHPEIIRQVEAGKNEELEREREDAERQAGDYESLIERRKELEINLDRAGADRRLSQAGADLDRAREDLQDKLEKALLHEATETLLDDVEQTYQTEHVPPTLKRAQVLFRAITHRAFDLKLEKDGKFTAQDTKQNARRELKELSSGTRMQLLLALRLAWIEAQEQGGETLPLFLDEALTTSDEERFAVMAKSLGRLEGRQIFYLSARRHECALWKQATGNEPSIIDLAMVRFPSEAHPPQDYDLAMPPPLPAPEGREPEEYASVLGVPPLDPRLEPGTAHPFHLLRDDLELLYQLMEKWRITSLGQLESLLGSDAASKAITADGLRERLQQRCAIVRVWVELWRRGRGRPVNRIALEQCGVVSRNFIDRVTELAEGLKGDGKALVKALRAGKVSRFQKDKIKELEHWLADEGYTDQEDILSAEARRRLTLQQVAPNPDADIEDINQVVTWLESALTSRSQ